MKFECKVCHYEANEAMEVCPVCKAKNAFVAKEPVLKGSKTYRSRLFLKKRRRTNRNTQKFGSSF